jgi:hypothetical protein
MLAQDAGLVVPCLFSSDSDTIGRITEALTSDEADYIMVCVYKGWEVGSKSGKFEKQNYVTHEL